MDVTLHCPCESHIELINAPELMACHTVAQWNERHAQCVAICQLENEDSTEGEGGTGD